VPAASLASWTREAGGHRHSPLRGRADSSAATAHGERRRNPSGSTSSRLAALKSRARRDVPVPGRTVLQPKIPRWHAVRRCAAQVCRRSGRQGRRQSPPGAPDGVLPPLMFEGKLLTPRTRKRRENESACRDNRRIDVAHQPTNSGNPALRFCESSRTRLANCFQASENLHDTYASIPLSEIRVRSVKCCRLPSLHRTGRKN
jgi:hypothetical protein